MRVVFAGTPDVAVPSLEALVDSPHDVVGVITRADARVGRGRRVAPSAVRARAQELGLDVLTVPPSAQEFVPWLRERDVDVVAVVAYGHLLPASVLSVPKFGWVNLHFSLLPAWRGAAPVQRAVMAGDAVTGASTFLIEEGMDTGPVFGVMTEAIRPTDTSGVLLERLAVAGAPLLVSTLDAIESGDAQPVAQDVEGVSYAPKLNAEDVRVDWTRPAHLVDRIIRGGTPDPGAWTLWGSEGVRVGVGPVVVDGGPGDVGLAPGQLHVTKRAVWVGTGSDPVRLGEVTVPGKRAMPASDWARGARLTSSEFFLIVLKKGHHG